MLQTRLCILPHYQYYACVMCFYPYQTLLFRAVLGSQQNWAEAYRELPSARCPQTRTASRPQHPCPSGTPVTAAKSCWAGSVTPSAPLRPGSAPGAEPPAGLDKCRVSQRSFTALSISGLCLSIPSSSLILGNHSFVFTASVHLVFSRMSHTIHSLFRPASFTDQYAFKVPPCLFISFKFWC